MIRHAGLIALRVGGTWRGVLIEGASGSTTPRSVSTITSAEWMPTLASIADSSVALSLQSP